MIDIIDPNELDVASHRHDYSSRLRSSNPASAPQLHETTSVMDPRADQQSTVSGHHWVHLHDVRVRSGYATVIVYSVREMDQNKT